MSSVSSVDAMDLVNENSVNGEIKVLVIYVESPLETEENHEQRLIIMGVQTSNIGIRDILVAAFPNNEVLKDPFGYKLVDDYTERKLYVIKHNTRPDLYPYLIKVMWPIARRQELSSFSNLFDSKKFSDVTLRVGDKDIYAHKILLTNKSSVFDAMFTHEMSESQSNVVEIEDVDSGTMCDFVHYLYTGKLWNKFNVFDRYLNLLVAADKYGVDSLKEKCEQKLPLYLTNENVFRCLVLADSHNAADLKKEVIDFIVENAEEIVELPAYKRFLELETDLGVETVRALVTEKKRKTQ